MSTEIEQLQSRIDRLRHDLEEAEAQMTRVMTDSTPPEAYNIYGIKTVADWQHQAWRGCWRGNYRPGYIAVFEPRGGGSYGGIYGALADELGAQLDSWNFGIYQQRRDAAHGDDSSKGE